MTTEGVGPRNALRDPDPVKHEWGTLPDNNFGYRSGQQQRAHRGLEDWESLDRMSDSEPGLMGWPHTVVGAVTAGVVIFALAAYGGYYIAYHYRPALLSPS